MNALAKTLRESIGNIVLTVVLLAGIGYYVYSYIPRQTTRLQYRYFRVLTRIGQNLLTQMATYHKLSESLVAHVRDTTRGQTSSQTAQWLETHWTNLQPESAKFGYVDYRPSPTSFTPHFVVRNGTLLFKYPVQPFAPAQSPPRRVRYDTLLTRVSPDSLVAHLTRPETFDYFFVLDAQKGELLYASTAGVLSTEDVRRLLPGPRDSTGLRTGRVARLPISSRPYQLFVQPLHLSPNTTWLLCGAVSTAILEADSRALPPGELEVFVALVLLGLMALPFLKIMLLNAREQLAHQDVILCGLSLVLGAGVLTLTLQSTVARNILEPDIISQQLQMLTDTAAQRLDAEFARKSDILLSAAQLSVPAHIPPGVPSVRIKSRALPPNLALELQANDLVSWIDPAGNTRYMYSATAPRPKYLPNLAQRPYFRGAQHITDTKQQYVFGAVVPYTGQTPRAILASSGPNPAWVCSLSTDLTNISRAILPPGYSFCVVDNNGEVLFHSNNRLNLSENLLQDCEPSTGLRTALLSPQGYSELLKSRYQGRNHLLRVKALNYPGLHVVALADLTLPMLHQRHALTVSSALLAGLWALGGLFLLLVTWLPPGRQLLVTSRNSFREFWPRNDFSVPYLLLTCSALLGIGLLICLDYYATNPLTSLVAILLLPLHQYGYWLHFLYRHRLADNSYVSGQEQLTPERRTGIRLSITGACVLLVTAGWICQQWDYPREWGKLLLFQGALLLLMQILWLGSEYVRHLPLHEQLRNRPGLTSRAGGVALGALVFLAVGFAAVCQPSTDWPLALLALATLLNVVLLTPLVIVAVALLVFGSALLRWVLARYRQWPLRPKYRSWYALALLGWVLMLGVVPAAFCFITAYRAEREQQVCYAHLHLHQQLEPVAAGGALFSNYQQLFFATTSRDTLVAVNDSHQLDSYYALLEGLHQRVNEPDAQSHWATPPNYIQWASRRMSVGNIYADYIAEQRQLSAPGGHLVEVSLFASVFESVVPNPFATSNWLDTRGPLLIGLSALVAVLALLLYLLLNYCVRLLFMPSIVMHEQIPAAATANEFPYIVHIFTLDPANSSYHRPRLPDEFSPNQPPATLLLDCRHLPNGDAATIKQWVQQQVASCCLPGSAKHTFQHFWRPAQRLLTAVDYARLRARIVLEHFEHHAHDPATTAAKGCLLRLLQDLGRDQIQVLSRVHPMAFLNGNLHPGEQQTPEQQLAWQAGNDLLYALAHFRAEYVPLAQFDQASGASAPDYQSVGLNKDFKSFVSRECSSMPFLRSAHQAVLYHLHQLHLFGYRNERDAVVLGIQRIAQFYFRSLWRMLSPQEQFVLYDLAQDGLVNPRNVQTLDSLMQKGYLRLDTKGRLWIINESFRNFILSSLSQQQALRFAQLDGPQGRWHRWQVPLLLLLVSGALFLFTTQRSLLSDAQTFFTGLAVLIPLVIKMLSFDYFTQGTRGSAEIKG